MVRPIAYHPDFFGEDADEAGSNRYECMIMYVRLPAEIYSCKCYDLIANEGVFAVIERSPDFKSPIDIDYKAGVAVCSPRETWSWWFHLV